MSLFVATAYLSLAVTLLSSSFGIVLGVLFRKTNLPLRDGLLLLFTLPILLPPYIISIAFSGLFSEWIFSFYGVLLVESIIYLPIPMLATYLLLGSINSSLEDSARVLCGWVCVLRRITIPLIAPHLLLISSIVFLLSLGNYSVANFLRYDTFVTQSFVEFSAFYEYGSFLLLTIFVSLIVLSILLLQRVYGEKNYATLFYRSTLTNRDLIDLKGYRYGILFIVLTLATCTIIAPVATLIRDSQSIENYAIAYEMVSESIYRSITYALVGASLTTIVGICLALLIATKRAFVVDFITVLLFALPGSLIGVLLIKLFNHAETSWIYSTPIIIILAYILKYSAISSRIFMANLAQLPKSFTQSAKLLGASKLQIFFYITAPLLKGSSLLSLFLIFIFLIRDTDTTMLLYSAGYDTFAVKLFTLMANSPKEILSALSLIMILIVTLPFLLILMVRRVW